MMRGPALAGWVLACLLVAAACDSDAGARPAPADIASIEARPAQRTGAAPAEAPSDVRLPSGTVVAIRPADSRRDGLLDVPADVRRSGWWRGGARLGDPFGSTLLAGHVDSVTQGLGPYAELLSVRAGDLLRVRSAHLEQVFVIRSLRLVPRGALREHRRIYAVDGVRRLTMVTCAPPYDARRRGYQNLAVVTALPVSPPRPRSSP